MSAEENSSKRFMKRETVATADGKFVVVSTVDLSGPYENDHRIPEATFMATGGHIETMVFPAQEDGTVTNWGEIDCARSMLLDGAETQHASMVAKWRVTQ